MHRIWVADTCALLEVRRYVRSPDNKHITAQKGVFAQLTKMAEAGLLVFPPETHRELKDGHEKLRKDEQKLHDHAFHFVEKMKATAQCAAKLSIVKELMGDDLVRRVIDPDAENDEADIYVLSVAVQIHREMGLVGVLTQERNDLPKKMSVATACGYLGMVCLPMPAFLHQQKIWALA